jgi:hypothetical protein
MQDLIVLALLAGFAVASWGLVELCHRLMGDRR